MADRISEERRSWNMSRIHSADTHPEKRVRSTLHKAGYRFRLHSHTLPGSPDIVLPKFRTVIFIHGCFWHRHIGCRYAYEPKSRVEFWTEKFTRNVRRDAMKTEQLIELGWQVLIVWECQTRKQADLFCVLTTLKAHLTQGIHASG